MSSFPSAIGQDPRRQAPRQPDGWSARRSALLYRVRDWGKGYFDVSERGTVIVRPAPAADVEIDLFDVVEGLRARDLPLPALIRFPQITAHRMNEIRRSFDEAIAETDYRGRYACVYPIKVNQARHVCEEVRDLGAKVGFGFEVGTKPELLAALALTEGLEEMPIVCNGFKDDEFLEAVVLATRLGRTIFPVVERFVELETLVALTRRTETRPAIGMRAKLSSQGSGRWQSSAGGRSKFGLSPSEMLRALELLRAEDMLDCLRLLHCHIGSQVSDIRTVKSAASEVAHVYVELHRAGAAMGLLDFGGGLGIDYEGSASPAEFSVNYDLEEYAHSVVRAVGAICDQASVPPPNLISESGRAIAGFSSVLVFDVLGSRRFDPAPDLAAISRDLGRREHPPQPLLDLLESFETVGSEEPATVFHTVTHARDSVSSLFRLGHLSLSDYSHAEELAWAAYRRVLERCGEDVPPELKSLPDQLSDIYFCNLSIFQSLPDAWAIDQVFPIMPIHRLHRKPTRLGILADMTCDSDGQIENFAGGGSGAAKSSLELHAVPEVIDPESPYVLGAFLVGAYQETLGDLHNLLGDVHTVHVRLEEDATWRLDQVVEGDTVETVLNYVQWDAVAMRDSMRRSVESAIRAGRLSVKEGNRLRQFYARALEGYTYPE